MVVTPAFRVFLCNTVTGKITTDLPGVSARWSMKLNDAGTVSVTLKPRAEEFAKLNIRGNTTPLMQSVGVAYGPHILECGPIWDRPYKGGTMDLPASGLWSIFDHRKAVSGAMLAATGPEVAKSKLNLTGSLGDIARELVRISVEDNPYGGGLNIVLPPVQGGTHERTYHGYDLAWIGDRLRELTGVQNGPDIRFRPRFNGADPTVVEWVLETGTEDQPLLQQAGSDWVWDGTAEQSGVVDFDHDGDATQMAAKSWAPGSGQEREMKLAAAVDESLIEQGYPWVEIDDAAKDVEDEAVLQGYADRRLDEAQAPWETISIRVRADAEPLLGQYRPGDWARIIIPEDHPTLDPGAVRVRIMGIDGDTTNTVSLTLAPVQDTTPDQTGAGQRVVDSDAPPYLPGTWSAQPSGTTWAELPPGSWREL